MNGQDTSVAEISINVDRGAGDISASGESISLLKEIRDVEANKVYARNPRELVRALECLSVLTVGEIIIHTALLRKGTNWNLGHIRLDYPKKDMDNDNKLILVRKEGDQIKSRSVPVNYHLLPPYAPTLKENYDKYSGL